MAIMDERAIDCRNLCELLRWEIVNLITCICFSDLKTIFAFNDFNKTQFIKSAYWQIAAKFQVKAIDDMTIQYWWALRKFSSLTMTQCEVNRMLNKISNVNAKKNLVEQNETFILTSSSPPKKKDNQLNFPNWQLSHQILLIQANLWGQVMCLHRQIYSGDCVRK